MPCLPRLQSIISNGAENQSLPELVGIPGPFSWSSKNIIARVINKNLHLFTYETSLGKYSGSVDLVGLVKGITTPRYWEGVSWHHSGEHLVLWDGFGIIDILQTLCANQLTILFSTNIKAPVLAIEWFPSQRPVVFQPEKGIGRGPFLGPRNPVGNLGLIVVSSSGYITVLYQKHSTSFSSVSCALPSPFSQNYSLGNSMIKSLSSASITYGLKGSAFITVNQPGQPNYTIFRLRIFLTDSNPSIRVENVLIFPIPSAMPCVNSIISHRTNSLMGPFQILTTGSSLVNKGSSWFSLITVDLVSEPAKVLAPTSFSEFIESNITYCDFFDSFIVIGLKNGIIQLRPLKEPKIILKSTTFSGLAKLCILQKNSTQNKFGYLVSVVSSANKSLLLIITSTHHWFILSLANWLGQELVPETQVISSILIGLEQGTDLIDIISCLSEKKQSSAEFNAVTNKQLIKDIIDQVTHHWSIIHQPSPFSLQRILVLYTVLHRYFPEGPGSITKFLLASRIQIARDILCASLTGDAKKPNFIFDNFNEMAPFATYALHCLVFVFRDLYIYYHTNTITDENKIIQGPVTPHLALLTHSSSSRVLADVVLWLQMLQFQLTQFRSNLPQHILPTVEIWMSSWTAFPVDPKIILKFLSALLLHLNKVQRSPTNPFLIPAFFPPWAVEHFITLKASLGTQFETMGEALLDFDTRWLGLSVGPSIPYTQLSPLLFSCTDCDLTNTKSTITNFDVFTHQNHIDLNDFKRSSINDSITIPKSINLVQDNFDTNISMISNSHNLLERLNLSNHSLIQPILTSTNTPPPGQFSFYQASPKRFKKDTLTDNQITNNLLTQLGLQPGGLDLSLPDDSLMAKTNSFGSKLLSPMSTTKPSEPVANISKVLTSSFPLICIRCRHQSNISKKIVGGPHPMFIRIIWPQKSCPCGGPWAANHHSPAA